MASSTGLGFGALMPSWMQQQASPQSVTPSAPIWQNPRQVMQDMGQGASHAIRDVGSLLKNHTPEMLAMGGSMLASTAVCSFMGGAMAATGGIMLGQHMAGRHQSPTA